MFIGKTYSTEYKKKKINIRNMKISCWPKFLYFMNLYFYIWKKENIINWLYKAYIFKWFIIDYYSFKTQLSILTTKYTKYNNGNSNIFVFFNHNIQYCIRSGKKHKSIVIYITKIESYSWMAFNYFYSTENGMKCIWTKKYRFLWII